MIIQQSIICFYSALINQVRGVPDHRTSKTLHAKSPYSIHPLGQYRSRMAASTSGMVKLSNQLILYEC